jgi:hypothetical protein
MTATDLISTFMVQSTWKDAPGLSLNTSLPCSDKVGIFQIFQIFRGTTGVALNEPSPQRQATTVQVALGTKDADAAITRDRVTPPLPSSL